MKPVLSLAICVVAALCVGACSGGGPSLGSSAAPAQPAPAPGAAPALPTGAALGGILGGSVGAQLDEADRQAAYNAQIDALETGQRRTWRGAHGAYGFVEPAQGGEVGQVACRGYTQTIYIGGRPQHGRGEGCRQPDGSWRMAS
jgi:surface antigen